MQSLVINNNFKKTTLFLINLMLFILLFSVLFQLSNIHYASRSNDLSGCEYKLAVSHWPF
jgi:hypothetical protein